MSNYRELSEEKRALVREKARMRYRENGVQHRARQYMKLLRGGVVRRSNPSTLERHGIVCCDDGVFRFVHELA